MAENNENIFRKKTIERISSPDQLTDYLHVTNPGIWMILAAVIILLAGILAWSMIGTLETKVEAQVNVDNSMGIVICDSEDAPAEGMLLRVGEQEYSITAARTDESGLTVGIAAVDLPDGTYDGIVVTEAVHPISFLLESR